VCVYFNIADERASVLLKLLRYCCAVLTADRCNDAIQAIRTVYKSAVKIKQHTHAAGQNIVCQFALFLFPFDWAHSMGP